MTDEPVTATAALRGHGGDDQPLGADEVGEMTDDPTRATAAHWSQGDENRHCAPLAVITEVTIFGGDPDSEDTYAVEVTWRGHDKYAVKRRSQVWNGSAWEYEPQPSSRDDDFIARTRFDYEQAMNLAAGLVAKEVARA